MTTNATERHAIPVILADGQTVKAFGEPRADGTTALATKQGDEIRLLVPADLKDPATHGLAVAILELELNMDAYENTRQALRLEYSQLNTTPRAGLALDSHQRARRIAGLKAQEKGLHSGIMNRLGKVSKFLDDHETERFVVGMLGPKGRAVAMGLEVFQTIMRHANPDKVRQDHVKSR